MFGARLSITFGMTETCGAVMQTAPTDPDRIRRETVGAPLAGTDVRIAGPDGAAVPPGVAGELWVRGARITRGYLDDPVATAETIDADGWLHTGDLAEMDGDGACRVVGRLKDMIKTGGENVSPVEVEELLVAHPDVARAAVVGVPDERWGELVVAFVVPADGRDPDPVELTEFCRDRAVAVQGAAPVARRGRPADDRVGEGAACRAEEAGGRRFPASRRRRVTRQATGCPDKVRVTPRAAAMSTGTWTWARPSLGTITDSAATTSLTALRIGTATPVASGWTWPGRTA